MTTIHAYTHEQNFSTTPRTRTCAGPAPRAQHRPDDDRRGQAIGLVLPELKGKLDGYALRVPVPTGSVTDLTVSSTATYPARRSTRPIARPRSPVRCRGTRLHRGPIVSSDIVTTRLVHARLPAHHRQANQVKVVGWYDNEWGYSNRLVDLCGLLGAL